MATRSDDHKLLLRLKDEITDLEDLDLQDRYADESVRAKKIDNDGKEDYINLRKIWSFYIAGILACSILFQMIVAMAVGIKWLSFENNQLLINLIMGENFLQIIGLAYIIVKFLYPQEK